MSLRAVGCVFVAGVVLGVGGLPARAVDLDPMPTREPTVTVLGASSAGVLYRVSPIDGRTPPVNWVKPTGGAAYQVPGSINQLGGSWIFGLEGPTYEVTYQQIGTPITRTCNQEHSMASATPFGWVTAAGQRVEVSATGCEVTAQLPRQFSIVAADAAGYVDLRYLSGGAGQRLTYYSYADLTHPREIDDAGYNSEVGAVAVRGSSVTWRSLDANKLPRIVRAQTDGSPAHLLATLADGGAPTTSIAGGSTGWATCDDYGANCRAGSIDANGTKHRLNGTRSVVSDGTRFIFDTHTTSYAVDAAAAVDATTPRTRIVNVSFLPPIAKTVALGAGGVAYVDSQPPLVGAPIEGVHEISQRGYSKSGTTITVSGQTRVGQNRDYQTGIARDGRRTAYLDTAGDLWLFRDDGVRTKVFTSVERVAIVVRPELRLSGTRLLWWKGLYTGDGCDMATCFPIYNNVIPMLYNVATGVSSPLTGPVDGRPATVWGSYLAYADSAQAVWRRDLSSNALVQVKPPGGSPIMDVAVNDDYVAWAICQPNCDPSMVTYRNMATKAAAVQIRTTGTREISLSGGHVVFATFPNPYSQDGGTLETLRLGTKAVGVVGPIYPGSGFSVHDETLGWVGTDGVAKLSSNPSFVAPPRLLGNTIGTASFTPSAGSWTPEFSISKALTTCTLTIRSGTTVRRVLTCPTTVGSARPSWNGIDSAGHLVPKGTYSWTLTASDSDGTLRWWTNATHPIAGTVRVT
jgi:hypothetical protein